MYFLPAAQMRAEIEVLNSRFMATIAPVSTVEEAKAFIQRIKTEFADATHNVPAFVVGHGAAVTAHCHDDGEPSGTAGRPALAVLQGSGLGDAAVVVTRYYGGQKLGTGGLVRAYGDAVREVLAITPRAQRVACHTALLAIPYTHLERVRLLAAEHNGQILEEEFTADITLTLRFQVAHFGPFQEALQELSHGTLTAEVIETGDLLLPTTQHSAPSTQH
jgi:uncharacterized YigZ family protein